MMILITHTKNPWLRDTTFKLEHWFGWDHHPVFHYVYIHDGVLETMGDIDEIYQKVQDAAIHWFEAYYFWELEQRGAD